MGCVIILSKERSAAGGDSNRGRGGGSRGEDKYGVIDRGEQRSCVPFTSLPLLRAPDPSHLSPVLSSLLGFKLHPKVDFFFFLKLCCGTSGTLHGTGVTQVPAEVQYLLVEGVPQLIHTLYVRHQRCYCDMKYLLIP